VTTEEIKKLEVAQIGDGNHVPCLLQRSPKQSVPTNTSRERSLFFHLKPSVGPVGLGKILLRISVKAHTSNKSPDRNATSSKFKTNKTKKSTSLLSLKAP